MKIRRAKLSDLATIWVIISRNFKEISEEQTKNSIKEMIKDKLYHLILIAENGDIFMGCVGGEIWRKRDFSYIEFLYTVDAFRKQGVGKALMLEFEKVSKTSTFTVLVDPDNLNSRSLMNKLNYRRKAHFYFYVKHHGKFITST